MQFLIILLVCYLSTINAQTPVPANCRFSGNDLGAAKVADFNGCYKMCLNNTNCNAFTMLQSKTCYIHNFPGDAPVIKVNNGDVNLCGVISRSLRPSKY